MVRRCIIGTSSWFIFMCIIGCASKDAETIFQSGEARFSAAGKHLSNADKAANPDEKASEISLAIE